jgi:hypothetical protein
MQKVETSPDDHLAEFPDGVRETMLELDRLITEAMPGRSRDVWSGTFWGGTEQHIVGYGDIVQPRPRGESVQWFAVGLARQKRHYSLYVNAVDEGAYLLDSFKNRLGEVKLGAASIGFSSLDELDLDALRELLRRADELTRDES